MSLVKFFICLVFLALISSCASQRKTAPNNDELTKALSTPEYQEKIYDCYEHLIIRKPKAEGRLTLNYIFNTKFKKEVKAIHVSKGLQDANFIKCVETQAKDVDVDVDYNNSIEVKNTYSFKSKAVPITPQRSKLKK